MSAAKKRAEKLDLMVLRRRRWIFSVLSTNEEGEMMRNVQGNLVITDANKKEAWIEHHERLLNIELSMVC